LRYLPRVRDCTGRHSIGGRDPVRPRVEPEAVKARGYWELVFIRFRRDRLAVASFGFIVFLFFAAFVGAPIAAHFLGHGPSDQFGYGVQDFVPGRALDAHPCGAVLRG
jgi:hypothetical protein